MMPYRFIGILALLAGSVLVVIPGCSRDIAGATTETTNGVVGKIVTSDNLPAAHAVVMLFPEDYDPVADSTQHRIVIDTADAEGMYRFSRIAAGRFTVIARDSRTSFQSRGIIVSNDSITTVSRGNLDRSGSITTDFSLSGVKQGGYVYIPGTDIFSTIGTDGSVVLDNVPPGTVDRVVFTSAQNEQRNVLRNEIVLAAGAAVSIEQPLWMYDCRITLNTTPAGAGVSDNAYDFPVLIRLNSSTFDFSQFRADGSDLVFRSRNGALLSCEIERWDAITGRAEVWVRVDTVYGNDSVQSIAMYWGASTPLALATGPTVFDASAGFEGVWHLGDATGDSIRDATVNKFNGISPEAAGPQITEGIIGNCRLFDGNDDFITMPNTAAGKLDFPQDGNYTVSAWVHLDTFDGTSHCIVSKGYQQYYLRSTYITKSGLSTASWEFVGFSQTDNWQTTASPVAGRPWTLLVGVRQGGRQQLYCDGVLVNDTFALWNNSFDRVTTNDLYIGRFKDKVSFPPVSENTGFNYFTGGIDEVRIESRAQSPGWIKLCYMNQRPDDRLVVFRR